MSMDAELKSCPFCGEAPEVSRWHGGGENKHAIFCFADICEANPMVTGESLALSIYHWNYRTVGFARYKVKERLAEDYHAQR